MIILAGPNGAGKSTFYDIVLRPRIKALFINADLIQREELGDPSMAAAYRAAAIAQSRRRQALERRISFISESTFSHPSKLDLIRDARAAGFRVVVYHINVRRPELSVSRVAQRVDEGGHDVPEDKIRERFERNQPLIREAVLLADHAFVYDNSGLNAPAQRVIAFREGRVIEASVDLPAWARALYGRDLGLH